MSVPTAEDLTVLHGEITIAVPAGAWEKLRLSMNDREHFHQRSSRTSWWRTQAMAACRNARLGPLEACRVEVWYRFPDNRRREVANLQKTSKAIVDGLVDARLVPDDSDSFCVGPDNRREPVNGPHEVRVVIYGEGTR
ncbi:hypothetical protein [Zhihengliuella halotolerans]|uniref:hypothetical protein n=1 Tax=Zhihengliuella halotolerans TaxID=370736 RepID=UPI000C80FB1E|nr:hypothetical protein [Zhihengliuella halotolerans]